VFPHSLIFNELPERIAHTTLYMLKINNFKFAKDGYTEQAQNKNMKQ
jgi:hypothetical protein